MIISVGCGIHGTNAKCQSAHDIHLSGVCCSSTSIRNKMKPKEIIRRLIDLTGNTKNKKQKLEDIKMEK